MSCDSTGGCPHRSVNIQYTGKCTLCHPGQPTALRNILSGGRVGKEACPECIRKQLLIDVLEEELMICRRK
jgi:hypothetical protein